MRWRSLQILLAVGLGSPRHRRELRVWSVKMVPAVPTRIGQMLTSYPRVWLRQLYRRPYWVLASLSFLVWLVPTLCKFARIYPPSAM